MKTPNPVRKEHLQIKEDLGRKYTSSKLVTSKGLIAMEFLKKNLLLLLQFVYTSSINVIAVSVDFTFAFHMREES